MCVPLPSSDGVSEGVKEWTLSFLRSPVEVLDSGWGRVGGVRLEHNRLEVHKYLKFFNDKCIIFN